MYIVYTARCCKVECIAGGHAIDGDAKGYVKLVRSVRTLGYPARLGPMELMRHTYTDATRFTEE